MSAPFTVLCKICNQTLPFEDAAAHAKECARKIPLSEDASESESHSAFMSQSGSDLSSLTSNGSSIGVVAPVFRITQKGSEERYNREVDMTIKTTGILVTTKDGTKTLYSHDFRIIKSFQSSGSSGFFRYKVVKRSMEKRKEMVYSFLTPEARKIHEVVRVRTQALAERLARRAQAREAAGEMKKRKRKISAGGSPLSLDARNARPAVTTSVRELLPSEEDGPVPVVTRGHYHPMIEEEEECIVELPVQVD